MPYAIEVDTEQEVGFVWCWGTITGDVVLEASHALYADAKWQPHFREFWDGRGITQLLLEWKDLQLLNQLETDGIAATFTGDKAVIARRGVVIAMVKAFIAMTRGKGRPIKIYYDTEEAQRLMDLENVPEPPEACCPFLDLS